MNKVLYVGRDLPDVNGIVEVLPGNYTDDGFLVRCSRNGDTFRTHAIKAFIEVGTTWANCSYCGLEYDSGYRKMIDPRCHGCNLSIVAARAAHLDDPYKIGHVWHGFPCLAPPTIEPVQDERCRDCDGLVGFETIDDACTRCYQSAMNRLMGA